jgi:uncharacterized SAM-binding protein YcdF (DUF218 family)
LKFLKIFTIFSFIFILFIFAELIIEYDTLNSFQQQNRNFNQKIDIIVVLTGHKGRIKQGLNFLKKLKPKYLIISGANPNSLKKNILYPYKNFENLFPKIIIENHSKNTRENAEEVKKILHQFKPPINILIITSTTHIKRAKFIFKKIFKNAQVNLFFLYAPEKLTLKKILIEKIKYFMIFFIFSFKNILYNLFL